MEEISGTAYSATCGERLVGICLSVAYWGKRVRRDGVLSSYGDVCPVLRIQNSLRHYIVHSQPQDKQYWRYGYNFEFSIIILEIVLLSARGCVQRVFQLTDQEQFLIVYLTLKLRIKLDLY